MRGIICVEEHTGSAAIDLAAAPFLMKDAAYIRRASSDRVAPPRDPRRPVLCSTKETGRLIRDLGEARLRAASQSR